MKKIFLLFTISIISYSFAQEKNSNPFDKEKILKNLAEDACKCIDSIYPGSKIKDSIASEISSCIDKIVPTYQFTLQVSESIDYEKLLNGEQDKTEQKIIITTDKNSKDYKNTYYELERYLNNNCKAIKEKIAVNDVLREKSMSSNKQALEYYDLGIEEFQNENYEKAISNYKKAIVFDKDFAFAYDNLGITYRKLNRFDEAIDAYEKSLKIDPNGQVPLQNIAIAYIYKKEYKKAIKYYEKLAKLDDSNPEVFYGIGNIYVQYINDYEKGLDNLCIAYNIYVATKSPYRTDAEQLINVAYSELKKQGKETTFFDILKKHNISSN